MATPNHMAKLMSRQLHNPHQSSTLEFCLTCVLFFGPLRHKSMNTMYTAIAITVAKAEIAEVLSEEVHIGQADHSKCISKLPLNRPHKLLQNHNRIILGVVKIVLLGFYAKALDLVVGLRLQNHNFARHIKCLHPFLEQI